MQTEAKELTAAEKITAAMADLGLTVHAVFVPWSQSRNRDERETDSAGKPTKRLRHSLNWRVTLYKARSATDTAPSISIVATDYSAGIAHCPAYKADIKAFGARLSIMRATAIIWECENGRACTMMDGSNRPAGYGPLLTPNACDVVASLVMDSNVLAAGGFEEWARDLGYDTDSRKAEATYKACLEIALKLRNGIGEAGLQQLRDACQDY